MTNRADELLALAEEIVLARATLAALVARHHALVAQIAGGAPPADTASALPSRPKFATNIPRLTAPLGANTGQQASIVDYMAAHRGPFTVAEIAKATGFAERTVYFGLVGGKRRRKLFDNPERSKWALTSAGRADHAKRHPATKEGAAAAE